MEMGTLLYAGNDWANLAAFLTYAERYDEALDALIRSRQVADLVGEDYLDAVAPQMRVAAHARRWDEVLTSAASWFDRVGASSGGIDFFNPQLASVLGGEPFRVSPFLAVLLPLAEALIATRHHDAGCRLVRMAPSLMNAARFCAWDAIGESRRWSALAANCPPEPLPATVEEAFDEASQAVAVSR